MIRLEKIIALIFAMIFACIGLVLVRCIWEITKMAPDNMRGNDRQGIFAIIDLIELGFGYYLAYFIVHLTGFLYDSTIGIFIVFWNV